MDFTNSASIAGTRVTRNGYLVTEARIARAGIQVYAGHEVGRPTMDEVRVLRPETEVFSRKTLTSFAHKPVTLGHPDRAVDSTNYSRFSVGHTEDPVTRDGEFVRVPLMLTDQAAIDAVKAGKRQLSCGYTCDLAWQPGLTPDGEMYDAVQTNIIANHLAIVSAGRAGSTCRIGDGADKEDHAMSLRKVTVDGRTVEMSDLAAEMVASLKAKLADAEAGMARLASEHQAAIAAKDNELGAKDAAIDALKASQMDAATLDAMVAERAGIVAKARMIVADLATEGMSNVAIRRAVVAARVGDAAVNGKSDDYVAARFDGLCDALADGLAGGFGGGFGGAWAGDPFRQAVRNAAPGAKPGWRDADPRAAAHAGMLDHLTQAWKGDNKETH